MTRKERDKNISCERTRAKKHLVTVTSDSNQKKLCYVKKNVLRPRHQIIIISTMTSFQDSQFIKIRFYNENLITSFLTMVSATEKF